MAYTYLHKFPNGKFYVGSTSLNPTKRYQAGHGYDSQQKMKEAIEQFGWDNVEHIEFALTNMADAERLETFLINELHTIEDGYNTFKKAQAVNMSALQLGNLIKEKRKKLRLTQEEVARLCGYSDKSMISHLESGGLNIPFEKLVSVMNVLCLTFEDLHLFLSQE